MSRYASTPMSADKIRVEYKRGTGDWTLIPGSASIRSGGGEAPSNTQNLFEGPYVSYGQPTPPTFTITLPGVQLLHQSVEDIEEMLASGEVFQIRWRKDDEIVLFPVTGTGVTIAIAATSGAITAVGTGHPNFATLAAIGPGAALKISGDETSGIQNYRIINAVGSGGAPADVTIKNIPSAAVTAAVYSVVVPPWHRPGFSAKVSGWESGGEAASAMDATLTVGALASPPRIRVGTP